MARSEHSVRCMRSNTASPYVTPNAQPLLADFQPSFDLAWNLSPRLMRPPSRRRAGRCVLQRAEYKWSIQSSCGASKAPRGAVPIGSRNNRGAPKGPALKEIWYLRSTLHFAGGVLPVSGLGVVPPGAVPVVPPVSEPGCAPGACVLGASV